jgi:uncharacterized protein (TIGR03437 family)
MKFRNLHMSKLTSGRVALLFAIVQAIPVTGQNPVAQTPRIPRGIYTVVDTENLINLQQQANPAITTAQLDAYFNSLYQDLLSNPAVSGLTLQVHWDRLNPNAPPAANAYDWTLVDEAFAQAAAWDAQNPSQTPKTIQLILTPGFQSPPWMLAQIPSCDGLFQSPVQTPPSTCGTVIFNGYSEAHDGNVFPLPWNPFYKSAWRTFLTALAARYGSNPAFVSIAVAGPTAASAEIILPGDDDSNNPQTQFSGGPISPDEMWLKLFAFHYPGMAAYQGTDQAFIDEWDAAIDMYGEVFSGVTLVATLDDKMPSFGNNTQPIPAGFSGDCSASSTTCATVTTILSYFVEPSAGGANAKATQTSSFIASNANISLGIRSVKNLSQLTAQLPAPSAQILAGIQVDKSFADFVVDVGCTAAFPPDASDTPKGCSLPATCTDASCTPVSCIPQACLAPGVTTAALASYTTFPNVPTTDLLSPEQALYNLLNIYFDGSAAAASFGGTPGAVPLNYLQLYSQDIQYASANVNAPAQVTEAGGVTVSTTVQAQLNLASQKLLTLAEPAIPAIAAGGIVPGTLEPGQWATIYGTNLASGTATWTGNFPTSLGGTTVTIGGKAAYLSFVSPGQIDFQVPNVTGTGAVPVVVTTAMGSGTANAALASFAPSFFLLDSKHVAGIIVRPNSSYDIIGPTGSSLGYPTVAAKAGDIIELFGTGFGPTNPPVAPGAPFSGAAPTTSAVAIRIGNANVTPAFAGLSGAGAYQINLTVPSGLGTGDVSLQATVGGVQTPSGVVISLQ